MPSFSVFLDGKKIGTMHAAGKGKEANSNLRKYAKRVNARMGNPRRKMNVEMGYWTGKGRHRVFHPIRDSSDYDPSRVGEGHSKRSRKKSKRRR